MNSQGRRQTHAEELPEGLLACDQCRTDGTVIYSLTGHALECISRHRWIESEQHGRDCGHQCDEEWIEQYWRGWARSKLLEHFMGWRCWGAFGEDSFGLLRRQSLMAMTDEETIAEIGQHLAQGAENLDIINWALENNREIDGILAMLERIDINAKRHRLLTDHIRLFI